MTIGDNLSIAREVYDCFNRKDFKAAAKLVDTKAELLIVPFNQTLKGPDGMAQMLGNWGKAFPDGKCNIKNVFCSGENVTVEFIGTGKQTGTFQTPDGEVLTTNKKVEVPFCDVFSIRNGKIVNFKTYFDYATFMKQLGVLPELKYH
jgi:steroid delta-isomerase-like uncharacterized protein